MKKRVQADHFQHFQYPCNLQAVGSSDLAFGLYSVNLEKDTYPYKSWMYAGGEMKEQPMCLEEAAWVRYLSDGTAVYCEEGAAESKLLRYDPAAEVGTEILTVPGSISQAQELSDGRWLLLRADNLQLEGLNEGEIADHSRYEMFEEYPFWYNGTGNCDRRRSRLYLWQQGCMTRISPEFLDVQHVAVVGNWAVVDGPEFLDIRRPRGKLYKIDLETLEAVRFQELYDHIYTALLPLDQWHVLALRSDQHEYGESQNETVDILDVRDGTYRRFNQDYEIYFCNALLTDVIYGAAASSYACIDGKLLFISTVWDQSPILSLDLETGAVETVLAGEFSVAEFVLSNDKKTLYLLAEQGDNGLELWTMDWKSRQLHQLTHYHDWLAETYFTAPVETFTYESTSGSTIAGYIMRPYGFQEGEKYPTVLTIHGGPNVAFGSRCYYHELQYLAACGYVVLFCNPHGSVGRGIAFEDLRDKYYTCDLEDILSLREYALTHFDFVDGRRMAVSGGSYGGMMVDWIIGHHHVFKTAISDRGCANELEDFFMSDCGYEFSLEIRGGTIWEPGIFEKVWDRSPIKYADQVRTPTLFVHGEHDLRCTKEQSLSMYAALKLHGVKTRACIFKDENHGLCWYGKPKNRMLRLEIMCRWLEETL